MKHLLPIVFSAFLLSCQSDITYPSRPDYTNFHHEAKTFCAENGFNRQFYFLVDFASHSGKFRFWVIDFETNSVVDSGLVSHGAFDVFDKNTNHDGHVKTSNVPESHCSMLGKYKVGNRDYSKWGIHVKYWLHGLEESNRTAVERVVVLHSWEALGDEEIYPRHAALSWGCPAVSNKFMKRLDKRLQQQKKPTLLWIVTT